MPSQVGKQPVEAEVVQQAVALEMDCISALTAAAERADDAATQRSFTRIAADCEAHVRAWQTRLLALDSPPGKANRTTSWLNRVKVQILAPFGERAIAFAVTNNPEDCMEAYERVAGRADLQAPTRALASQMLQDAALHKALIDEVRHPGAGRTQAPPASKEAP